MKKILKSNVKIVNNIPQCTPSQIPVNLENIRLWDKISKENLNEKKKNEKNKC